MSPSTAAWHQVRHALELTGSMTWEITATLPPCCSPAVLVIRFLRTGGPAMLAMMGGGPDDMSRHDGGHDGHDQGGHDHGARA